MLWQSTAEQDTGIAEFDSNTASWKLLEKKLTEWMRKEKNIQSDLSNLSLEEQSEC